MVLVTGATGTVGSRVAARLRPKGVPVRAFVRDPAKAAQTLGDDVQLAVGDFSDPATIRVALSGVQRVFLASPNHPRQVEHETTVIDAARDAGVQAIVKLSTIGARTSSPLAFWDAHGRIEEHLEHSGVPAVVLRPNFYMSNLLASAASVREQGKLYAPAAGARIAMIDPRDVADVAAVVLSSGGHEGQRYELSGPEAITFQRVAEKLSTMTRQPVEFCDVPDAVARQNLLATGMPEWFASQLVILFGLLRQGAAASVTDTVERLTGHRPRSIAQFVRDHASGFLPPAGGRDTADGDRPSVS